jgi:hypothetical protein
MLLYLNLTFHLFEGNEKRRKAAQVFKYVLVQRTEADMAMEFQVPGLSQCVLSDTVYNDSKDNSAAIFTVRQADYITSRKFVKLY